MSKHKTTETGNALRKLITEGFKEYDGDIREEALELLQELESNQLVLAAKNKSLECKNIELTEDADIELTEIDFGTGKIMYKIEPFSAITVHELMQALKNAALVVPLASIINGIKNCNGAPRF